MFSDIQKLNTYVYYFNLINGDNVEKLVYFKFFDDKLYDGLNYLNLGYFLLLETLSIK